MVLIFSTTGGDGMKAKTEARIIEVIELAIVFCLGGVIGWMLKVQIG